MRRSWPNLGLRPRCCSATRATTPTPSWPTSSIAASPPSSRPNAIERSSPSSTATSTPCEIWSSAASQSSSTAAGWPPDTTRPPTATSASSFSLPCAYGLGTSSTGPSEIQPRPIHFLEKLVQLSVQGFFSVFIQINGGINLLSQPFDLELDLGLVGWFDRH